MTWNFRVFRAPSGEYTLHEVYYRDGQPEAWSGTPYAPIGDTLEELRADVAQLLAAIDRNLPVLEVVGAGESELREVQP